MLKEHWFEIYLLGAFIFMAWNPWNVNNKFVPILLSIAWPITAPIEMWNNHRKSLYFVIAGISVITVLFSIGVHFMDEQYDERERIIIQQTITEVKRQCDGPLPLRLDGESYSCRRIK